MLTRPRNLAAAFAACIGLALGNALQAQTLEIEPNSSKSEATLVTLNGFAGGGTGVNQFTGLCTGTATTVGSTDPTSVDTWRIRTQPAPVGIYRHVLALTTSGTSGHVLTLRGLSQTAGIIGTMDAFAQTSATGTVPPRAIAWYGFGKQEEIFCRVQGLAATTAPYLCSLTSTPIAPTSTTALLVAGQIEIRVAQVGAFLIDSDVWLYDADLNAIPGAGNDDEFGTPSVTSRLLRSLAPGTYTLAVGRFNLANNLPSPSDDDFRSGVVLDFPNVLANSQVNPTGPNSTGVANVILSDALNAPVIIPLNFGPGTIGDIQFLRFTVYPAGVVTGACCSPQGTCSLVAGASNCGAGHVYLGDQTTCSTANPCPQPGSCCTPAACCFIALQATCPGVWGGPGTTCTSNPCPAAPNDSCSGATPISLGASIPTSNCEATTSNDGPPATCASDSGQGVWFVFVPPATASYTLSTCGSNQDSVLQIFTSPDCVSFIPIACDNDSCDGVNPPGSTLAARIAGAMLVAGQPYLIRVSTFGQTPTGQPFVLSVSAVASFGACCTTGSCTITDAAGCQGTFTDAGVCTPNPCPVSAGVCCRGATCAVLDPLACTPALNAGATFTAGSAICDFGPVSASCCLADYDKAAGVTINDIFAFLNDWFAGSPLANFGTDGTLPPPDVNTIFSFLNAWFAGGC
ncbi:MAG: hypothetical protein K2W85_02745 [Phycisphaerales bacterium]|nr:hypothetical protein [Phycisphaerales bacterium]